MLASSYRHVRAECGRILILRDVLGEETRFDDPWPVLVREEKLPPFLAEKEPGLDKGGFGKRKCACLKVSLEVVLVCMLLSEPFFTHVHKHSPHDIQHHSALLLKKTPQIPCCCMLVQIGACAYECASIKN